MDVVIEFLDKYGWGGIMMMALAGAIFFGGKWLSNKLSDDMSTGLEKVGEKLTDQMSKQNDQLLNIIIDQQDKLFDNILSKRTVDAQKHNEMLFDKIKIADEINQSLKEIMLFHNAQRAFIIEFHNTSSNLSGVPFAKYSCTYEWHDKGVFSLIGKCNSLPFSQIAKVTTDVLNSKNQIMVYTDMEKFADENISIWSIISSKEPKTTLIVYAAMYDKNNVLVGMMCLEYQKEHVFTDEDINQLGVETAQLTSIINLRYKYTE